MNRTDSPFSTEPYTHEKHNEEFFYDFDRHAKTYTDTDEERYTSNYNDNENDWW